MTVTIENDEDFKHNRGVSEKFTVSFIEYLKVKLKPSFCSLSSKEKSLKNVLDLYEKEIDLLNIIEKLQEIDKLKDILLSKEQKLMFESMQKPTIMSKVRESLKKDRKKT